MVHRTPLLLAAGVALLVNLLWGGVVQAHGKAVNIALTCITPDPARPLTKVCTAFLKYADGDAVPDATFLVTARREGQALATLGPVQLKPLDRAGVYSGMLTFPAYGRWRMRFEVRGSGTGEAELVDEILPPLPGAAPDVRARLQVVFKFGLTDVRNLAIRIIHLLAAAAWFALVGLVLVLSRYTAPDQRWRVLRRWTVTFPRTAAVLLLLVAASGMTNAIYNTPTRPPGVFAPKAVAGLPFGQVYLVAFSLKMGLMLAIVAATAALALALRRTYGPVPIVTGAAPGSAAFRRAPDRAVTSLAILNLTLGLLTFASVVVLGYLHMISHVAAAAGAR